MTNPIINVDLDTLNKRMKLSGFNKIAAQNPNWSREEINILRNLYPDNPSKELTLFINRSEQAIRHKAAKLGITKSESFLKSCESGRFRPAPLKSKFIKRLLNIFGYKC